MVWNLSCRGHKQKSLNRYDLGIFCFNNLTYYYPYNKTCKYILQV